MANRLLTIFFCAFASPAFAQMPPPEYDRPYQGDMETHLVEYGRAADKCLSLGADVPLYVDGRHLYGCQFFIGSLCVIVVSQSKEDKKMMDNVYRHERAHCNGWPADHPN